MGGINGFGFIPEKVNPPEQEEGDNLTFAPTSEM